MAYRKILAAAAALVVLAGCITSGIDEDFMKGSRAAFDNIEPKYRAYVNADPALVGPQRDSRLLVLDEWGRLIDKAEQAEK